MRSVSPGAALMVTERNVMYPRCGRFASCDSLSLGAALMVTERNVMYPREATLYRRAQP